ncbi:MAG: hypothetical protein V1859_01985 [archaeon]
MPTDKTVVEEIPYTSIENVTTTFEKDVVICQNKTFDYFREWRAISNDGRYSTPRIYIQNQENRYGVFNFKFYFFNNETHPHERYYGREYDDFKDELSREMADMESKFIGEVFGPGESKIISAQTDKKNRSATYWALATISAPEYEQCIEKKIYSNLTEQKQITKYKTIVSKKRIFENISLFSYIFDHNFYYVIIAAAIIILILLVLVVRERIAKT